MPISRRLIPNLPSREMARKIQEAERLADAGERELAFYLSEFKARKLFKNFSCQSFSEYIRKRTGIGARRALDLARVEGSAITACTARRALERAGIDRFGLSETDRRILEVLAERGRPVGVRSPADILGEHPQTLAEVYEPYLLREGYLNRTWRGRTATEKGGGRSS